MQTLPLVAGPDLELGVVAGAGDGVPPVGTVGVGLQQVVQKGEHGERFAIVGSPRVHETTI